ncbi:hypothetical protein VNI00_012980 [Paramarasmius palmivorus]|uniref:F-box domain-containing protein n=1 Tax=Paramarasmius palmivorus TaxID=297713 RepID=A0AAW0C214_9AGAR
MKSPKSLKTTRQTTYPQEMTQQTSIGATKATEPLSVQELFDKAATVYKKDAKRFGGALRRFWDTAFEEGKKFGLEEARKEAFRVSMEAAYGQRVLEQGEELKKELRKELSEQIRAEIESELMKSNSDKAPSAVEKNRPIVDQQSALHLHLDPRPSIDYLPPEILSKIFLLTDVRSAIYLPSLTQIYPMNIDPSYRRSNSTGSHLGCVCRYWRGVTLNTPALWSSIFMDMDAPSLKARKNFEMHIERSATNFLSITLLFRTFSFGPCRRWMNQSSNLDLDQVPEAWRIMKCIIGHATRVRELSLCLPTANDNGDAFATSFMPAFRHRFGNLAHLVVYTHRNDPYVVLNAFTASPLRSIEIRDSSTTYDAQKHHFPCSRLTNVVIEDTNLTLATEVLSKSLSLRSARLDLRQNTPLPFNTSQCLLTNLSDLDLEITVDRFIRDIDVSFVNLLAFPALVSLSFTMLKARDSTVLPEKPAFSQAFIRFVKRSPKVQTFRLAWTYFNDEEMLMVLKEMQELTIFEFGVHGSFNGGLLIKELGEGRVAPKLKELKVRWFAGEIDWEVWKEMIHRRWLAEPPLRSVYLKVGAYFSVPESVQSWVQDMQLKGRAVMFGGFP